LHPPALGKEVPLNEELMTREVFHHKGSALNNSTRITADARDENGGSHHYRIDLIGGAPETGGVQFDLPPFQKGPLLEAGFNGISDEALLGILIDRLEGFQEGPYRSRYNALAVTELEEAMHWLNARTADRQKRGVEGTHQV
jgi:hypothetical protein